jgi:flagellar biosynthesis protein FlhF
VIKHLCRAGEQIGCTHLVLTHCDELIHWGKLWDILLGSGLTPLFLGTGQNVAGDLEENVIPAILARTFPMLGKEAAEQAVAS